MAGSGTAHLRDDGLLRIEHLVVEFPGPSGGRVHAVSDVSLEVREGETLALVGESGCGKSTTARAILQLPRPTAGRVTFDGAELTVLRGAEMRRIRPKLQMIFQDPISSLNPRRRIADIVADPLVIAGADDAATRRDRVRATLEAVGLDADRTGNRRPHEFSGGQCQRICIARALIMEPKLLICDEPVSSLDVSVQAQILNLLSDMRDRYGLTMLFISHDLAVVKNVSDRIAVMYLGKLCEVAQAADLYAAPAHPYTATLLESIPVPDPSVPPKKSPPALAEPPSPVAPPSGCRYHTRCTSARDRCRQEEPVIREIRPGQFAACHFPLTVTAS
jgi:peptide/nickel transport system ATP-binding protein